MALNTCTVVHSPTTDEDLRELVLASASEDDDDNVGARAGDGALAISHWKASSTHHQEAEP